MSDDSRIDQRAIHQAFNVATRHHSAGRLQEAEAIYREILRAQPRSADALHLLGLIASPARRAHSARRVSLYQRNP